jgi:hypothetical protein
MEDIHMPIQLKPPTADIPYYMQLMPPTMEEPETTDRYISHLPQRMHDQEKLYSPALKRHDSRFGEAAENLQAEEYRRERCKEHEKKYSKLLEDYMNNQFEEKFTIEELNDGIRWFNDYYGRSGCPALPEVKPPPTLATKP